MMNNFIKTLVSGLALSLALYSPLRAEIRTGSDCDGKCTYYYDTVSGELRFKRNENVPDSENVAVSDVFARSAAARGFEYYYAGVHSVILEEGMNGLGHWSLATYNITVGRDDGKLVLPSTYKYNPANGEELWYTKFGTIDVSKVKDVNMPISVGASTNIILDPSSNTHVSVSSGYNTIPENINIICKGKKSDCESMVNTGFNLTSEYYKGLDENGNYTEWSDDGLAVYADSTKAKPLGNYDFNGNQTGVYTYDGAGNLTAAYKNGVTIYTKTLYTPAEAAAAVKEDNSNTVTITFK